MRYNLYTIKSSNLKYILYWVLTDTYCYAVATTITIQNISSRQDVPCVPLQSVLTSQPLAPDNHWFAFYPYNYTSSKISDKWTYTICSLCVWFLSLCIMLLRFVQVAACITRLFLLLLSGILLPGHGTICLSIYQLIH